MRSDRRCGFKIFESELWLGFTPFESVALVLCCLGAAYLCYLAANIMRIVRAVRKSKHQ